MSEMVEKVARAMASAEFGYSLDLTRLVDGVRTYTLVYSDGSGALEFEGSDDACEHIAHKRKEAQARAILQALREPTETMLSAADSAIPRFEIDEETGRRIMGRDGALECWRAAIDAALK